MRGTFPSFYLAGAYLDVQSGSSGSAVRVSLDWKAAARCSPRLSGRLPMHRGPARADGRLTAQADQLPF